MSTAKTLLLPTERVEWYRDLDGVWTTSKHKDSVRAYPIDWTDQLASGETISSVAYEASGVTVDSSSLATPVSTMVISDTNGGVKVTATTSASRDLVEVFRFVGTPQHKRVNDYQWSA